VYSGGGLSGLGPTGLGTTGLGPGQQSAQRPGTQIPIYLGPLLTKAALLELVVVVAVFVAPEMTIEIATIKISRE
jgi:hypothetical protein